MKFDLRSLGAKLWVYFALFSAAILIMLWFLQIVFLNSFYEGMKTKAIEAAAAEIAESYENGDYEKTVDQLAYKNSILIYITDQEGTLVYTSDEHGPGEGRGPQGPEGLMGLGETVGLEGDNGGDNGPPSRPVSQRPLPRDFNDFLNRLQQSGEDSVSYPINQDNFSGQTLVYGMKLQGAVLYVSTPLEPLDVTTTILGRQLIYVTVISLLLGFVIAFFISKKLARPIAKITKTAAHLAQGDYAVAFDKGDYLEIDELAATLNYTARELSKVEQLRRELIANISHDLRTPLTMIKGYTEMIEEVSGDDKAKRTKHLKIIQEETSRLETLVSDILDLSVLQAGCETIDLQNVNMSETVRNVITRFAALFEQEGYVMKADIEFDQYVLADKPRIEQVLYNLIANAVNYAGDDKTIQVSLVDKGSSVRFEVKDNGVGIPEEERPYIWERYYQAKEHVRAKAGTGIGLSIVKSILQRHNAQFGVESALGDGSTFWFELKK